MVQNSEGCCGSSFPASRFACHRSHIGKRGIAGPICQLRSRRTANEKGHGMCRPSGCVNIAVSRIRRPPTLLNYLPLAARVERDRRVKEVLQSTLRDGTLEVEFTIKEKNRKILALMDELSRRDATAAELRDRAAKAEQALLATQKGARSRVKELIEQRQAMQERIMSMELGMPLAVASPSSTAA